MSTAMSYQSIYSFVSQQSSTISQSSRQPLLLPTKCLKIDSSLCYYTSRRKRNLSKIETISSQISVSYNTTLLSPSKNIIPDNSQKKSSNMILRSSSISYKNHNWFCILTLLFYVLDEAALILIRHGESLWNAKNLFTGCVDVPLTEKGVEEAIEAGKISNIPIDVIFTSSLIRAQMTAVLAMIQHRRKKVPIILHNESDQAKSWSQVFSEETKDQSVPVIPAWQLNERMYGELQGLNKQETAERYGKQQVHEWRRSYDIPPPKGESLEMCAERAVAYFEENIEPKLAAGKNVMIAAHGNSLRSIIMYLDKLTCKEVISLELSTGIPLLYIFKDGKFMKRGSPVGPTEAGVYAYTKVRHRFYCSTIFVFFEFSVLDGSLCLQRLAQYRQKLDESSEVICS
ncbi:2,3-bisphosphoglycerate-dependent phosphoglycerate mutase isoform X1 [Brassica rapa]|uniref:2,3-bisphosphoglycerate-dependent phosphoglycerate mutase isoform X1 n=1 Tax=Brassica campestris TaxID=3711 RepID=UPI00142D8FF8|nr:2,3-bisphosphoglycerate-dependent phosphoglycerate mutase isoform X1 [Brassica rapa]